VTNASVLPEMVRNVRIQLRPRRMLAAALICALATITAFIYYANSSANDPWANLLVFLSTWR